MYKNDNDLFKNINTVEHVYNEIEGTEKNCFLYPSFAIKVNYHIVLK